MPRRSPRLRAHMLALACLAIVAEAAAFSPLPSLPLAPPRAHKPRSTLSIRCGVAPSQGAGAVQGRRLVIGSVLSQGLLLLSGGCVHPAGAAEMDSGVEGAKREAKRKQQKEKEREEKVRDKAARAAAELKEQQEKEAEGLRNSDLGKLLLKRTKENSAANAADVRQKQCMRMCPSKPLGREPVTRMELICEECALEFGIIPGAEKYEKKTP